MTYAEKKEGESGLKLIFPRFGRLKAAAKGKSWTEKENVECYEFKSELDNILPCMHCLKTLRRHHEYLAKKDL